MLPTLRIGQSVTTDNAAMRAHPPSIGDIIVFHPPRGADALTPECASRSEGAGHTQACGEPTDAASNQTFIKRVVGLPGDRIAIVDGHVIRNGIREHDPYVYVGACGTDAACNFQTPVAIPRGDYFVLGDNRGQSDDSRFWGPVRRTLIIGVVRP
jgi:signal peptidase I